MDKLKQNSDALKSEMENCYHLIDSIYKVFDILQDHIHELSNRVAKMQEKEDQDEK